MGRWNSFEADLGLCGAFEVFGEPHLLFHVFLFLDVVSIFRLRGVCRSWYDAVFSPQFTRLYKPPTTPWAVLRVRTEQLPGRARYGRDEIDNDYDGHFDYFMRLESHVMVWRGNELVKCGLALGPLGSHFVGMTGSNGLVCGMIMQHRDSLTLAVGNPFTNKWKVLPPAPLGSKFIPRPAQTSIVMKATPLGYSIAILFIDGSDYGGMCRYDSSVAAWRSCPVHLGSLLNTSGENSAFLLNPDFHVAYDLSSDTFSHKPDELGWPSCGELQRELGLELGLSLQLIECFFYKGKWIWATLLVEDVLDGHNLGYAMWQVDVDVKEDERKWVLLSWVLCRDLFGEAWGMESEQSDMKLDVVEDMVFISAFYRKETFGFWPPVSYNLELKTWKTCVQKHAIVEVTETCFCLHDDMECCYVVVPSLTAEP